MKKTTDFQPSVMIIDENIRQLMWSDLLENFKAFAEIITKHPKMLSLFQYMEAIAPSLQPVMIIGETGVGKELFAKAIHTLSDRKGKLIPVNAAGLDDTFFSDTLFGHVKGAFTGANQARQGLIESATHGTLFLDEIGDLDLSSQVKLLRLLQEGEYLPLGHDEPKYTDARVVVATNKNIRALQKIGKFREDLIYRLKIHHINIPPLRERIGDLSILIQHFVKKFTPVLQQKPPKISNELITWLETYHFPGNIRELQGMIIDTMARGAKSGELSLEHIQSYLTEPVPKNKQITDKSCSFGNFIQLPTLKEADEMLIAEAMKRAGGNQTQAAKMLGITQPSLSARLKRMKSKVPK